MDRVGHTVLVKIGIPGLHSKAPESKFRDGASEYHFSASMSGGSEHSSV